MNYAIIIICLSYLNNYNLMRMIGDSIKDLFYVAPFTLVSKTPAVFTLMRNSLKWDVLTARPQSFVYYILHKCFVVFQSNMFNSLFLISSGVKGISLVTIWIFYIWNFHLIRVLHCCHNKNACVHADWQDWEPWFVINFFEVTMTWCLAYV